MLRLLSALVLLSMVTRAYADADSANGLERQAHKLTIAGELVLTAGALLLLATAVRTAVPAATLTSCEDPCLDHARVRDMAILSGTATAVFAVGVPLLILARSERKHARLQLQGAALALRY